MVSVPVSFLPSPATSTAAGQKSGKFSKAFAGQAIGDATQILGDYSILWIMGLIVGGMLLFRYWQRKRAVDQSTTAEQPTKKPSRPLVELEQWVETIAALGTPPQLIQKIVHEQSSWSEAECQLVLNRVIARQNLKQAYGSFITEQKLNELNQFIAQSLEQKMSQEKIMAHLVEAEWDSGLIREYVKAYVRRV